MKKKSILTLFIMMLVFVSTGCNNDNKKILNDTILNDYAKVDGDLEIVKWSYSAKEPDNPVKNSVSFKGDITMGSKNNMSKKAVNINLKKGQSLRVETKTDYPITVMLKDNSNEQYLFNKTLKPVEGAILIDAVKKDGQYELMVDFNEIDEFTFKVYVVNQNPNNMMN